MRRALEGPVRAWWHGEAGIAGLLLGPLASPFSLVFGAGVRLRNLLYDRKILSAGRGPIPVISVGNLVVGGTGKTPVARWFVERLQERGWTPALVSRGYGQDELLLHRRWNPDVPVLEAPRRLEGVRTAARKGADICVVDDGFQHRRLARNMDVVLLSPDDPLPPRLLPRGPYREPLGSLRRAHLIIVTAHGEAREAAAMELARKLGRREGFPPAIAFPLHPGPWTTLTGEAHEAPHGPALVVSSVARPEGVARLAREAGVEVARALSFPDHHRFGETDLEEIRRTAGGLPAVTTEKDAVKLESFEASLPPTHVLTLRPKLDRGLTRVVDRILTERLDPAPPDEGSRSDTGDTPDPARHGSGEGT